MHLNKIGVKPAARASPVRAHPRKLALLGGLRCEWRRHAHDLVTTTFWTARLARSMFGHGFDALEGLLALIAAIDVGWHSRGPPFTSKFDVTEYVAPDPAGERTVPPLRPPRLARSRSGDSVRRKPLACFRSTPNHGLRRAPAVGPTSSGPSPIDVPARAFLGTVCSCVRLEATIRRPAPQELSGAVQQRRAYGTRVHGPGAAWRWWTLHGDRDLRTEDKTKAM
jgi:hypothetical protein